MQYQSECLEALKSAAKINKPFEKVFMDTLKVFLAITGKGNFLQIGRYGEFSEQTYTMTDLTNHHCSALEPLYLKIKVSNTRYPER